jgi:hypothetical protein
MFANLREFYWIHHVKDLDNTEKTVLKCAEEYRVEKRFLGAEHLKYTYK